MILLPLAIRFIIPDWHCYCKDGAIITLTWHFLNSSIIMLHFNFAQASRWGAFLHASMFSSTFGHALPTFQLFANSNGLVTNIPLWVVKSLFLLSSKFPQRPHTLPCANTQQSLYSSHLDPNFVECAGWPLMICKLNHFTPIFLWVSGVG